MEYARPDRLEDALDLLSEKKWSILAGGTDFYPALGDKPLSQPVLDISALSRLRGIREDDLHWTIGGLTTWTDILKSPLPAAFDALKLAAREIGSVQIQNVATLAGNLCNASPAADGVPALQIVDAEVELCSSSGSRWVALDNFITGNRRTVRRCDELLTSVRMPKASCTGRSHFLKLGARKYLVISIAMVAIRLDGARDDRVTAAAVAVGACSEVARRLGDLEAELAGAAYDETFLCARVKPSHFTGLSPIDDVRSSAAYRLDAAEGLVRQAIGQCLAGHI